MAHTAYSIYRGLTNQGGLDALNEELPGPEVAAAHVQGLSVLAPGLGRRPAIGPYVHMAALLVVANLLYYRIITLYQELHRNPPNVQQCESHPQTARLSCPAGQRWSPSRTVAHWGPAL